MFNEEELQTLISGRMEEGLDLQDMQAHTGYAGVCLLLKLLTLLKYLHTGYAGVCLQFRSLTLSKVSQQEKGLTCRICKHTPDTLVLFRSLTLLFLFKSLTLSKYLHLEKGLACRICKHTLVTLVCVCHQDD